MAKGGKILRSETIDGTTTTVYTDMFAMGDADLAAFHLEVTDDSTTLAITVTLWASCKADPSDADDTDWVQMTSSHGYTGLPGGNPTGSDTKDMVDIGDLGGSFYRFKFARTAGSGVIDGWLTIKDKT